MRHSTLLRADVSTGIYGQAMSLGDGHSTQQASTKTGSERVSRPNGVCNVHLRRVDIRHRARRKNVTAVHTASEHEHVEVVFAQNKPAFVSHIKPGITEKPTDGDEFLIVNLQDVAAFKRLANHFLIVESLPKVDIENLQTVFRNCAAPAIPSTLRGNDGPRFRVRA